jgi:uncharacterized protein DUF3859
MSRLMFLIVAPFLIGPDSRPTKPWSATIVDFGVYEVARGDTLADEAVAGGLVEVYGKELIEQTDQVAATLGASFGFRYTISGPADGANVTIKVLHPRPLRDPVTGRELATSEWSQWVPTNQANWNTGWCFEHDWEIAAGTWVIQLWIDGQLLLEKSFTVSDGR